MSRSASLTGAGRGYRATAYTALQAAGKVPVLDEEGSDPEQEMCSQTFHDSHLTVTYAVFFMKTCEPSVCEFR